MQGKVHVDAMGQIGLRGTAEGIPEAVLAA